MNYFISRGGQQYGPYALPDLQNYIAQGSIQYSDLARTDTMSEWLPLSQVLKQPLQSAPVAAVAPMTPVTPHGTGPIPPSLHWALVLLLGMFTGLFHYVWMFVQSTFVKKIDPLSKATMLYVWGLVVMLGGFAVALAFILVLAATNQNADIGSYATGIQALAGLGMVVVGLAGAALFIAGSFNIRSSMLRYYNSVEPINLRLSAVMTFFFNILYFQYHFSRIAKWKETGVIYPQ